MCSQRSGGDPNRDYSPPVSRPLDAYKQINLHGTDQQKYQYRNQNSTGLDSYQFDFGANFRNNKGRSQTYVEPGRYLSDYGVHTRPDTLYYNTGTAGLNQYNRLNEERLMGAYGTQTVDSARGGLAKAAQFAYSTPGVVFRYNGNEGILYDLREKHRGYYEDVEDGFTPDRTNYDESTVTLAELAAQVKTLKRDLKRAGIL